MRKIWMRIGVSIDMSENEEEKVFGENQEAAAEAVRKIVADGRFLLDGDSYIPETSVEDFNKRYGTGHDEAEIDFDFCQEERHR